MSNKDDQLQPAGDASIAVIGMAGRFPGARSVDEFWERLRDGAETISFFSDEELVEAGVSKNLLAHPNYVKARGVFEGADMFDASFFGFTPREAEIMNPQHRVLLECAWEALENAGYDPETYRAPVGVFAGGGLNLYLLNVMGHPDLVRDGLGWQAGLLNWQDTLTTNVSYKLNLHGPSLDVQTFCSTSLVAVHVACQSLLNGECDMALAGGVKVTVPLKLGYLYQDGGINPPDGHCRAFDALAQGTPAGNGVALVVLKRLADAIDDGDYIHAILRGSAINNDGSVKVGFTAPSVEGQAQVISEALGVAGVDAETITYVEAHGTGTPLGDPIEIAALTKAFSASTQKRNFCAVGSVKTNMGHLDAAAGIAGLIKTILALKNRMLPPSLHFVQPNPVIDFANSAFYVNANLAPWQANGAPRRAGVSSFGIGGTNAHVIVEEAPAYVPAVARRPWQLLCFSARTMTALEASTSNLTHHLREHPELSLPDVAYTLNVGRRAFAHRRFLVCRDTEDAIAAFEALDPQRIYQAKASETGEERRMIFMFPGLGPQYPNMAHELYCDEPTFRAEVDRGFTILEPLLGYDPRQVLFPSDETLAEATSAFKDISFISPAMFLIQYALAKLLIEWGIRPQAMIGHSFGEYVAACIAGVMSFEEALQLVTLRGQLMQTTAEGGMLSLPMSATEAESLLGQHCSLAALNAPKLCVISGPTDEIDALARVVSERGLDANRVHVNIAAHSDLMTPIMETFGKAVSKIRLRPPNIPYVSNVTGTWITDEQATSPSYWVEHLRQPVRFSDGMHELLKQKGSVLLEVGPGRTLSTLVRQHTDVSAAGAIINCIRHPSDKEADEVVLLNALGKLWLAGVNIDWSAFHANQQPRRVPLPTYPFERQRFWVDAAAAVDVAPQSEKREDAAYKKTELRDWFYLPVWKRSISPAAPATSRKSRWLVFGDEGGLAEKIVRGLEWEGHEVITVLASERFEVVNERVFRLCPDRRSDYDALFSELRTEDRLPERIVHAWSVTRDDARSPDSAFLNKCLSTGFYSLLYLTQALVEQYAAAPVRIEVLTSEAQDVTGGEELCAEKAVVFGPCKVIRQEYPNVVCRSIDLTLPEADKWREEKLLELLLQELSSDATDTEVAYRDNHRWVQSFEQIRSDAPGPQTLLRKGGVYLITGGLGRVGSAFAQHLAREIGARLVLVNRRPADHVASRINTLQELERLGSEVLTVQADVTDEAQMRQAVAQAYEHFGALHGVIHAVKGTGRASHLIPDLDREQAEIYFHPKARGLFVLEKVVRGRPLDFCLLTSTISSVLGGLGLFSVTATNALLDAFAQRMNQIGPVPWISVDWDFWRFGELDQQGRPFVKSFAELGITPQEGVSVFSHLLSPLTPSRVIISSGDLQARIAQWVSPEPETTVKEPVKSARHPRPELTNMYVAPSSRVEQTIADIWQELLGIETVGIYDNFFELGGHSLLATQIIGRLRETFRINLPLRALFESPAIRDLAMVIEATLVKEIDKLSDEEAERLLQQEA
ncbi:MAG TPA: SDR family NAD(P)-dependent oxidoreductase [Pyrinomonadaceae bacterium]|nr:SDR family NAD(P)-dependent oxidoreductase [Pyrinomonadaceae bacterium]